MVDVKEWIPKSSVKLLNFKFTNAGKLKQSVKNKLKAIYSELDHSGDESPPNACEQT